MRRQISLPLRFKMLVTILLIVFTITCTITFLMAKIFHDDKASYINDLTSSLALSLSKEVNTNLIGYRDRLLLFTRLIYDREISQKHKSRLIKQIFEDFQEFIAIGITEKGAEPVYIYDLKRLSEVGLDQEKLREYGENEIPTANRLKLGQGFVKNSTLSPELPSLSLSIAQPHQDDGRPVIITAIISLENLLQITGNSLTHDYFIIDSQGTILVHPETSYVIDRARADWIPDLEARRQGLSKTTTLKFNYQNESYIAAFASTAFADLLVGVQISEQIAFLTAREFLNQLLLTSFMFLICAAALGIILSRQITGPLEKLTRATREIGRGNFIINIQSESRDEIGTLTNSFNKMAEELDTREKALIEAEDMASKDGMTGLFNHRYFQEALATELARAKRYNLEFSLIFLDLDHFKNYNDTNGHPAGDEVLKRLAKILLINTRGTDIVARYGGEEFTIILPETLRGQAYLLAEKLRKEIETYPFSGEKTQPLGKVTASMGIATFPTDANNPAVLLKHADDKLYEAKAKGRNVVCV
jgi:diguanylate cyclase (GGDEF)-like protein